jgi:hypothetical protein
MVGISKKRKRLESLTYNHDGRPSVGNDELLGRLMLEHGGPEERGAELTEMMLDIVHVQLDELDSRRKKKSEKKREG